MRSEATLGEESNAGSEGLYMAFELAERNWRVVFCSNGGRQRERSVRARDLEALEVEIAAAKKRLGLPAEAAVASCYEAGRDGFWLDRALKSRGIANLVVDASSIEVARRLRRAKTDRLDAAKLMALLLRWSRGDRTVWSVVRVPDAADEDIRQLSRSIGRLKEERARHVIRIKALLAKEGLKAGHIGGRDWQERLDALRLWDGSGLGTWLKRDLVLEGERLALIEKQLAELKAERDKLVAAGRSGIAVAAGKLARVGAIAAESSFVFAAELFGWRRFRNRRELAGAVGIGGTPYNSGGSVREQGISKSGNPRMRTMLVEIAWCWLKYQPRSALSRWFEDRFAKAGGRTRRIGIVALARKLLVALWRYLEDGVVPEGATLKPGA